jgi:hypothetical protein
MFGARSSYRNEKLGSFGTIAVHRINHTSLRKYPRPRELPLCVLVVPLMIMLNCTFSNVRLLSLYLFKY